MKTVAIIRDRGQLTIPEQVRKIAPWTTTSSVVSISIDKSDEIIITPHQGKNELEWERLFEFVKKSRAIGGKGKGSASEFLAKERTKN